LTTVLIRRLVPAVGLVFLLAACGTAATPSPSASSPAATSASLAPSDPPSEPPPTEEPSEEPTTPEVDLEAAAEALEDVDSYKLSFIVEGASDATVDAVIIRDPEPAWHYTTVTGGQTAEIIIIGDQAWLGSGGTFQAVPASTVTGMIQPFDLVLLMGQMNQPGVAEALQDEGQEEKNGVPTTHYIIDENSPGVGAASFPPGASFDLWIADEGYLVALEALGTGSGVDRLSINVTDVNSSDNVVEPPE
jgi:hypothetical protein